MITINKYGQNVDLSNIPVINGKKSFTIDNIDVNNTLKINIPAGTKFTSALDENDVKMEFRDNDGNIFELILKDLAVILATNDGDAIVEVFRDNSEVALASITDLNSALAAAAAGGNQGGNDNSDNSRNTGFDNGDINLENNSYANADIDSAPAPLQNLASPLVSAFNNVNDAPTIDLIQTQTVNEDEVLTVSFNSEDLDGDELSFTTSASNGTVSVENNVITYIPNKDFNGSDIVTITADDGNGGTFTQSFDVNVTPVNDAPVIANTTATLSSLSEDDFLTLSGMENAYYVVSEADVYAALGVSDVDVNDGLSISLITDSSNFVLNGTDVTSNVNGVIQLTQTDITNFGLTNVNVGDFFIYSTEFDSMSSTDNTEVSFQVVANDGTENSNTGTVSVTVAGSNDAPVIANTTATLSSLSEDDFLTLSGMENAYYVVSEADVYAALGVSDVDVNDGLSISLITDSSNFVLNGTDVTSNVNGVIQLTQTDITNFGLTNVNVGDFFIYSTEFDSMSSTDNTEVSFQVVANDGTENSNTGTVSVTVTGSNDAPVIANTTATLSSLSEDDFLTLSGMENAYYVVSEADVYAALGVSDVDVNDGLSISLITDSSNFVLNGTDVTSNVNGVIQLTQTDITNFGLTNVNVGDFFIYSTEFDSMSSTDNTEVSFQVVANDGTENSNTGTVSVTVTGSNDAPVIANTTATLSSLSEDDFLTLSGMENAYYVVSEADVYAALGVSDVDVNDGLSISLITDSSNFVLNGTDVTSNVNGVIQLTQTDITNFGLTNVNVGDFFIYSTEFDSMSSTDNTEVSFQVVANDGTENSNTGTVSVTVTGADESISGTSIDGYISGMTVFADTDNDGILDSGEANTLTNYAGEYGLEPSASGTIIGEGGIDISTGLDFDGQYKTLSNESVLNPTTTLVVNLIAEGLTQAQAETLIQNVLNVPSSIDLLSDPIESSLNTTNQTEIDAYIQLQTMNIMIENAVSQIAAAAVSAGYATKKEAYIAASEEFAKLLITNSSTMSSIDDILEDLINNTFTNIDSSHTAVDFLGTTGVASLVNIISNTNSAISQATNNSSSTLESLEDLVKVQVVTREIEEKIETVEEQLSTISTNYSTQVILDDSADSEVGAITKEEALIYSLDPTTVSVTATISGINSISSLVDINTQEVVDAVNEIKPVFLDYVTTGNIMGLLTLSEDTIETSKEVYADLRDFYNANPNALGGIVLIKDFVVANKTSIVNNSSLIASDIELLQTLATEQNLNDLIELYNLTSQFMDNTTGLKDLVKTITADNNIEISELMSLDPNLLMQAEPIRLQIQTLLTNNPSLINYLDFASVMNKLQEIITVDEALGEVSIEVNVDSTIAEDIVSIDENTGEYTILSTYLDAFTGLTDIEVEFDYTTTDSSGLFLGRSTEVFNTTGESAPYSGIVSFESPILFSLDPTTVSVTATISGINSISSLVDINTQEVVDAVNEIKPVFLDYVTTGNIMGLLTLSEDTIETSKEVYADLRDFYNANPNALGGIVLIKDFVVANKTSIVNNSSLIASDIELLQTLATEQNLNDLIELYNLTSQFMDNTTGLKDLVKTITADNNIEISELMSLDPNLLMQAEPIRLQIQTLLTNNPSLINYLDFASVMNKLQEIITVDEALGEVSIEVNVDSTIAEDIVSIDENTGEYTILSTYLDAFTGLTDIEVEFDYTTTDSSGLFLGRSTETYVIDSSDESEAISLDDEGNLFFNTQDIDLASILDNTASSFDLSDIDSLDLSSSEHILSNLTIEDFQAMVSEDSANILSIKGEDNDTIKLDLSTWSKDTNDTDLNNSVDLSDDSYIAYTAVGTDNQVLTLLIDKDIVVENI